MRMTRKTEEKGRLRQGQRDWKSKKVEDKEMTREIECDRQR